MENTNKTEGKTSTLAVQVEETAKEKALEFLQYAAEFSNVAMNSQRHSKAKIAQKAFNDMCLIKDYINQARKLLEEDN